MKTLTRRQLSREPSALKRILPGESVQVPDENGGLVITRRKGRQDTAAEMMADVDKLTGHWAPLDTRALLEDEA